MVNNLGVGEILTGVHADARTLSDIVSRGAIRARNVQPQ